MSAQLVANEISSSSRMRQQLDEHSRVLGEILQRQASIQDQIQLPATEQAPLLPDTAAGVPSISHTSLENVVRIRAHAYQPRQSSCLSHCSCRCHNMRLHHSFKHVQNILGALFIGYSRYPVHAFQECDEACCASKSFQGYVYYTFPCWLLTKTLAISFSGRLLENIQINLSVRAIIPSDAEIFRLVGLNDVNGIKEHMRLGLTSPNDSEINGYSILQVRIPESTVKCAAVSSTFRRRGVADSGINRMPSKDAIEIPVNFSSRLEQILTLRDSMEPCKYN